MNTMKRLREIFNLDYDNDIPIKIENKESKISSYKYSITEYEALKIAKKNLTKEYIRILKNNDITYVSLYLKMTKIVEYNAKKYYYIKASGGEVSGIEKDTYWDREITKEDYKKLRCLIDVDTGDYKYINERDVMWKNLI